MTLTAERVTPGPAIGNRDLFRLSETTTASDPDFRSAKELHFDHIVVSRGRAGDTCAFPSDAEGRILDMMGFGYATGPSIWLFDSEVDTYVNACIAQHLRDGGTASRVYSERDDA